MSYEQELGKRVSQECAESLKDHQVTVKHSSGLYRHWRCQKPGTWVCGFDIVTWPGSLCFTGDMGEYLFQRTDDMVAFMARSARSTSYAAEKCVAHDGRLREFAEEVFFQALADRLNEARENESSGFNEAKDTREIEERVQEIRDNFDADQSPETAYRAMYESGLWDSAELPRCEYYTYHFLWCLEAIKWFCDRVE